MALTIKELENAKPKAKKYKMLDGGGLSLLILPTGTKLWLWRYEVVPVVWTVFPDL
jgi:hypothetical protein